MPTISVVIPTRDRPQFVRQALKSLAAQTFSDFDVVVADNPANAPCDRVVSEFEDDRFRYLPAERPLSMHENWERGCAAASGEYVGVMIDKTLWLPSTMSRAIAIMEDHSASVLSWWTSSFVPSDEEADLTSGIYHPNPLEAPTPQEFSGAEELTRAMTFGVPRGSEGPSYFRGKICFGLYRQDVLDGMRRQFGGLFRPISPDYVSRVASLLTASRCVDAGASLQLSFMSRTSTGGRVSADPLVAKRFLDDIDPGLIDQLPIPGVFASHHNIVAYDYLPAEQKGVARLDRGNLARRAREDLDAIDRWPSRSVRRRQYRLLAAGERRAGISRMEVERTRARKSREHWSSETARRWHHLREAQYKALISRPQLHNSLRRLRGRPPLSPPSERPAPPAEPRTLAEAILSAESRISDYPDRDVRDLRRDQSPR
jgi:glycosyltransferase involved in cell wall biosynthesis